MPPDPSKYENLTKPEKEALDIATALFCKRHDDFKLDVVKDQCEGWNIYWRHRSEVFDCCLFLYEDFDIANIDNGGYSVALKADSLYVDLYGKDENKPMKAHKPFADALIEAWVRHKRAEAEVRQNDDLRRQQAAVEKLRALNNDPWPPL